MRTLSIICCLVLSTAAISQSQDIWLQKDSINGAPRSAASSFVVQGEGYSITGLDYEGFRRKVYSYTIWQDDWDSEESLGGINGGGLERGSASAFAINDKGYVCLGQGTTNPFFKDLWEFDPVTNVWTQKADFLGSARRMAVGFAIDSLGYVGTGIDITGMKKDMYKYNPATNMWTQLNDFGGTARKEAVGFAMGGQGYVGTGDDGVMRNDFWQYQPIADTWTQKANFPGTARKGAVGWGVFPQAFICTGEDVTFTYTKDLWEYNYFSDTWTQRADFMGAGRTNAMAFVLQGQGFVGSGYNGQFFDDLYAYTKVLEVDENDIYDAITVYPNPASENINIKVDPTDLSIEVFAVDGRILTNQLDIIQTIGGFNINRGDLPAGNYVINLVHSTKGKVYQQKLVFI